MLFNVTAVQDAIASVRGWNCETNPFGKDTSTAENLYGRCPMRLEKHFEFIATYSN